MSGHTRKSGRALFRAAFAARKSTTKTDWNPELYRRFEDERTRPSAELLAHVSLTTAQHVVDLGCRPGNSTELLTARFPNARVLLGTDNARRRRGLAALRPFLEPLTPELCAEFLAAYEQRIDAAYPEAAEGQRLLAFPRLFIVAQRKA